MVVRRRPGPGARVHRAGPADRRAPDADPVPGGRVLRAAIAAPARHRRVRPRQARPARRSMGLRRRRPGAADHLHQLRVTGRADRVPRVLDRRLLGADVPAGCLLVPRRAAGAVPGGRLDLGGEREAAVVGAGAGAARSVVLPGLHRPDGGRRDPRLAEPRPGRLGPVRLAVRHPAGPHRVLRRVFRAWHHRGAPRLADPGGLPAGCPDVGRRRLRDRDRVPRVPAHGQPRHRPRAHRGRAAVLGVLPRGGDGGRGGLRALGLMDGQGVAGAGRELVRDLLRPPADPVPARVGAGGRAGPGARQGHGAGRRDGDGLAGGERASCLRRIPPRVRRAF